MDDSFNKVFIGSGLVAELFLHALIYHKGESPEDFYVIGKRAERCRELMQKYKIRANTNPDMFISKAKVVVLAVDIDCLQDIPDLVASIRDKVPPNALINSITPHLKIAEIEKYFPNHPVLRLGLNLSVISGAGVGTFCCGSVDKEDTRSLAQFLVGCFGEVIEVDTEENFERIWNLIFASSCGNYLSFNCQIDAMLKMGLNPALAKKIVVNVYKGTAETFDKKFDDDILKNAFDYTGIFESGLKIQENLGIIAEIDRATHTNPLELQKNLEANLEKIRNAVKISENEKVAVHYKYWS